MNDLLAMLKAEYGLVPPDSVSRAVPLAAEHLPDTACREEEVALLAISDVANVNCLHSADPLQFTPVGLTLIIGDNGSGKSGYARILKRATRARGQEKRILPNVFDAGYLAAPPASASIRVRITGPDTERDEVLAWRDDRSAPDLLSRVRVFDSRAAAVYVNETVRRAVRALQLGPPSLAGTDLR